MMRILYIGNKLARHGNNSTSIDTLGTLLEAEGFKMTYASSAKNQIMRMLEMLWKTLCSAGKVNYVLIDTYSTANFWYAFAVSQLCRVLGLKYIPILHGGNLPQRLRNNPKISRMIFANSHCNVSPSGFLVSAFAEAGHTNVVYIPNSIEISNYSFRSRAQFNCKILWVRSFAKIYNPLMALEVMNHLQSPYASATLCMVGPDKENMMPAIKQSAADLGINVTFTGPLTKKQWTELADHYDIFINCTHFDNMPVSVIEAMALGLPVVSTNVGGIPFLLQHGKTALLVDDNDSAGMASRITELINNQQLASSIAVNARILAEEFDWLKVKKDWLEILR
ncbi:MAG TPA: glycosyltransferase family 4 protein [Flavobacterium sp.]|jgi:glycosyltransferase involved in cell wall biosynthesis